jgi:hypothetical protein
MVQRGIGGGGKKRSRSSAQLTSDVFLLGSTLLWRGGFLDVQGEFVFGLISIDGTGRKVF